MSPPTLPYKKRILGLGMQSIQLANFDLDALPNAARLMRASLIGDLPEQRIVMTDLNSLMIFAKVVKAESSSVAARLLKMPTLTISRRVADLESQLGVRLLERAAV